MMRIGMLDRGKSLHNGLEATKSLSPGPRVLLLCFGLLTEADDGQLCKDCDASNLRVGGHWYVGTETAGRPCEYFVTSIRPK